MGAFIVCNRICSLYDGGLLLVVVCYCCCSYFFLQYTYHHCQFTTNSWTLCLLIYPVPLGYHNNMIMCCGLWKAKAMLKESALAVCEQPNNSIAVFDEMITEDLIYSQFSRSLLGDETLDCAAYPEGSPSCDRLFSLLSVAVILLIITLITVFSGFCAAVFCTFYWRRKYIIVSSNEKYQDTNYHKANSLSDLSVDSGSGNKSASKKSPLNRMMNLFSPPKSKRTDMINARDAMRRQLTNNNASKLSVVNNRKVIDGNCTPSDGRCSSASTSSSAVHSQKDVRVQWDHLYFFFFSFSTSTSSFSTISHYAQPKLNKQTNKLMEQWFYPSQDLIRWFDTMFNTIIIYARSICMNISIYNCHQFFPSSTLVHG